MPRLHAESPGLSLAETTARREPRPRHIIYVVLERRTGKSAFLESRFPAGAMQELARWPLAPRGPAAPQSRLWAAGPTGPLLTPTPPRPSDFAQMPVLPLPGGAKEGGQGSARPTGARPRGAGAPRRQAGFGVDGRRDVGRDSGIRGGGATLQHTRDRGLGPGVALRAAGRAAAPHGRNSTALGIRGLSVCAVDGPRGGRPGPRVSAARCQPRAFPGPGGVGEHGRVRPVRPVPCPHG